MHDEARFEQAALNAVATNWRLARCPVMMIASTDCRARAHEALTVGASALTPDVTLAWEAIAAQWTALAAQAEAHESLRRNFIDGSPG